MSKIKNTISLIPARMNSSRFPGKPMALINGKPMIGHVHDIVKKNKKINKVVVATCDKIIFEYITKIGGEAVMTSKKHQRASDRCAEALKKIEQKYKIKYDLIVMVQGDEPMITQEMLNKAIKPFNKDKSIGVVNLLSNFENKKEYLSPNSIKVICDKNKNAIYFCRKLDETIYNSKKIIFGKQVCIIPFRRRNLIEYLNLKPTGMEIKESIDMWRLIENGQKVKMVKINNLTFAVDTKKDLNKVANILGK